MKRTLIICLGIIALALVGCNKETNTWGKLEQGSVTLEVDSCVQLTFTHNGNKHPQWSSDDPFIASVDGDGKVTANHVGKTTVYVNNLACEVTVFDDYSGDELEMLTYFNIDLNYVDAWEKELRGNLSSQYKDTIYDSVVVQYMKYDTIYTTPDSTKYDIVVTERDTTAYVYAKFATFDYSNRTLAQVFDNVEYHFSYTYDKKTNTYYPYLHAYTMRVSADYTKDDLIRTLVENRFYETDDPDVFYYYVSATKICKLFIYTKNNKTYITVDPQK